MSSSSSDLTSKLAGCSRRPNNGPPAFQKWSGIRKESRGAHPLSLCDLQPPQDAIDDGRHID
ncbi:MAG: hypothetical protein VX257_10075, partial [Planctomycetota bacterium]|nr:hypothetical protein [Planctomycetota bacterium]